MKAGITGHQDLGSIETSGWITDTISDTIEAYGVTYGFTSLAIGADQLFAKILISKGIPYQAVIPCAGYEQTFDDKHLKNYKSLLSLSDEVLKLDYEEPSEEAFFAAGKQVAKMSDLVVAVWNGKEAQGLGGTADVVKYATKQRKKVVHLNPVTQKVDEIVNTSDSREETNG